MASLHLEQQNAVFLHVPKTAGRSVTTALSDTFPDAVAYPSRGLGERDSAAEFVARKVGRQTIGQAFTFCFVRNPWDWTVSGWKHVTDRKSAYRSNPPDFREFLLGDWRSGAIRNPQKMKFKSARAHVAYHTKVTQWQHTSIGKSPAPIAFFGRFEHLSDDWARICERLGRDVSLPHKNKAERSAYEDYYDDETRAFVAKANAALIERFGYRFGD